MMRQILFVAVDAYQIFERAGHARLHVRLELRQIDDHIRLDDFTRDEVLMTPSRVRAREQARVVAGDAEVPAAVRDRFEKALVSEVEEDETLFGLHAFGRVPHAVLERADRPS